MRKRDIASKSGLLKSLFFLQHAGSANFSFYPRFLFTQKEKKPRKGHFIDLLNGHKFLYVRR